MTTFVEEDRDAPVKQAWRENLLHMEYDYQRGMPLHETGR